MFLNNIMTPCQYLDYVYQKLKIIRAQCSNVKLLNVSILIFIMNYLKLSFLLNLLLSSEMSKL